MPDYIPQTLAEQQAKPWRDRVPWVQYGPPRIIIPMHMREGIALYIEHGIPHIGSFMRAILTCDLRECVACADDENVEHLVDYVRFFYNYCPNGSTGTPENVKMWQSLGGLVGFLTKRGSSTG